VSTVRFSNYDASFWAFAGNAEYAARRFSWARGVTVRALCAMFERQPLALHRDSAGAGFLMTIAVLVGLILHLDPVRVSAAPGSNPCARHSSTSLPSFAYRVASVDYIDLGPVSRALFFFTGLIGGCAGSTACSIQAIFPISVVVRVNPRPEQKKNCSASLAPRHLPAAMMAAHQVAMS